MIIQNQIHRTAHLEREAEFFLLRYRADSGPKHLLVFSVIRSGDDYTAVGYPFDVRTGTTDKHFGAVRHIHRSKWASAMPFRVEEVLR